MKTRIVVAAHREYWMPKEEVYLPVLVGAKGHISTGAGWTRDDAGENISEKNETFCELTGLYWAWKHLEAEAIGLCHYRRYLGNRKIWRAKQERILREREIEKLLGKADVILPYPRHYWIETRESQYRHAHHAEDLRIAEQVLREKHPEYLDAWQWMLKRRSGHICNMFIMRRSLFQEYCEWLFGILFEVEKRLDLTGYSEKDRRVFGYLGERLLDVWIRKRGLRYTEVPMVLLEKTRWLSKGSAFLRRKYFGGNKHK